ncbi:MAG: hypothetical protein IJZ24_04050 [Clostridia bacterium]|nr:hypothetical protein [Clostridia bacterium]
MSDDLSFNGAEFAKPVENKGKYKKKRLMFIGLYVAFAGLWLYIALGLTKAAPIIAILPLLLYILYLATWRYCNFEWLIRVNVGKITLYHVYNKKEKEKHSFMAKTILSALPDTQENFDKLKADATVLDFRTAPDEKEAYLFLYEEGGKKTLVRASVCRAVVVAARRYSENVIVDKDFLLV